VNDLPVNDIIETLVTVVRHHRQRASADENAMDVDPTSSSPSKEVPPSIPVFLALVINYPKPTTPSQTILALKRYLRDPEDVCGVAETLVAWLRTLSLQAKNYNAGAGGGPGGGADVGTGGGGIWPSKKDAEVVGVVGEQGVVVYSLKRRERRLVKSAGRKVGGPPVFEKVCLCLLSFSFLPSFLPSFLRLYHYTFFLSSPLRPRIYNT
jgi:hypothetical protein